MNKHYIAIDCGSYGWGWGVMLDKGEHFQLIYVGKSEAYARAQCEKLNHETTYPNFASRPATIGG